MNKFDKGLISALFAGYFALFGTFAVMNTAEHQAREETIKRAVMTLYKPVGNGGAISEAYNGPNKQRQIMYNQMRRVAEELRK